MSTIAPDQAERQYEQQARLGQAAAVLGENAWNAIPQRERTNQPQSLIDTLVGILVRFQLLAAMWGQDHVRRSVEEQGVTPNPAGRVNTQALAGIASDGRDLQTLLQSPSIVAKERLGQGASPDQADTLGRATLVSIMDTQVADASRVATSVASTADREIAGYERHVRLPACGRCIVLAGTLYRWSTGFERHPRCDCVTTPVTSDEWHDADPGNTPETLFSGMSPEEQDRWFTQDTAQAIRDGADITQVVNVKGVNAAGEHRAGARLMPEAIYQQANGDRDRAIELLGQHGYLI